LSWQKRVNIPLICFDKYGVNVIEIAAFNK